MNLRLTANAHVRADTKFVVERIPSSFADMEDFAVVRLGHDLGLIMPSDEKVAELRDVLDAYLAGQATQVAA